MMRLSKYSAWLLSAALLAFFTAASPAQDATQSSTQPNSAQSNQQQNPSTSGQAGESAGQTQNQNAAAAPAANAGKGTHSLTGCLKKTDNGFTLTTKAGKTYDLEAENGRIDFAKHVGHKVRVIGRIEEGGAANQPAGSAQDHPEFAVTHRHHISMHCSYKSSQQSGMSMGAGTP